MSNPFSKLVHPWYPAMAVGIEKSFASMVHLERGRNNVYFLRRGATVGFPPQLITPSFDGLNISDPAALAVTLSELAASAGLLKQKRWSITLPEGSTRTLIFIMETQPGSSGELEEMLNWKIERGFSSSLEELAVSKERLPKDSQGRDRYLTVAIKHSVREEYERVFESLGWRAGLILPRHLGEAQWLMRNGSPGDGLLLSFSDDGFTAAVFRDKQPIILRTIVCDPEECEDELYRLLLFYRERRGGQDQENPPVLSRLLVVGEGFEKRRVNEIVNETLDANLRILSAPEIGLQLPAEQVDFDMIAGPAGLATLSGK
jgi:hypothetical protein